MIIQTSLQVNLNTVETLTYGFSATNVPNQLLPQVPFSNGTGSGQVDLHWELPSVTLAAGASVTYTLSALTDLLGRAVALAKVRALLVQVLSRTAGDYLTVGNAATHPFTAPFGGTTPTLKVYDLAVLAATLTDGFAVAAGANDQLLIANSGTHPITFAIALAGTSV